MGGGDGIVEVAFGGVEAEEPGDIFCEADEVCAPRVEAEMAGFELAPIEHLVDQSCQTRGVVVHELAVASGFVGAYLSFDEFSKRVGNEGQRGSQFVRDVREEMQFQFVEFTVFLGRHLFQPDAAA